MVSLTDLYAHFADHDAILDVFWIILLKEMKMWYTVSVNKALTTHAITGIKVNQRKDTKEKKKGRLFQPQPAPFLHARKIQCSSQLTLGRSPEKEIQIFLG